MSILFYSILKWSDQEHSAGIFNKNETVITMLPTVTWSLASSVIYSILIKYFNAVKMWFYENIYYCRFH